jgi:2-oxoglutarate ferredoxin oxidoreductase subunit alpha
MMLRARYLADIDCWGEVRGKPIKPDAIYRVVSDKLAQGRR